MARILVIESDEQARGVIEQALRKAGHKVHVANSAGEGLRVARERRPDVAVVDLAEDERASACEALERDQATRDVRVLAVTSEEEERAPLADDAIAQPFTMKELVRRIEVLLREPAAPREGTIAFGPLRVDRASGEVTVGGQPVALTTLERKLLVLLHDRRGRVQTREALLGDVWGIQADIETRTVDTHVKRLREKLGLAGEFVHTVRGVGYRFASAPDEPPPPRKKGQ